MITFYEVSRRDYLFGHRRVMATGTTGPFPMGVLSQVAQSGERVYGIAIATRSEVRAVRVAIERAGAPAAAAIGRDGGPSRWFELVEGSPLIIDADGDHQLYLDRLDAHDGRCVLAFALTPEARDALPRTIARETSIVIDAAAELDPDDAFLCAVNLAFPRSAHGPADSVGQHALHGEGLNTNDDGDPLETAVRGLVRNPRDGTVVLQTSTPLAPVQVWAANVAAPVTPVMLRGFDSCRVFFQDGEDEGGWTWRGRLCVR